MASGVRIYRGGTRAPGSLPERYGADGGKHAAGCQRQGRRHAAPQGNVIVTLKLLLSLPEPLRGNIIE